MDQGDRALWWRGLAPFGPRLNRTRLRSPGSSADRLVPDVETTTYQVPQELRHLFALTEWTSAIEPVASHVENVTEKQARRIASLQVQSRWAPFVIVALTLFLNGVLSTKSVTWVDVCRAQVKTGEGDAAYRHALISERGCHHRCHVREMGEGDEMCPFREGDPFDVEVDCGCPAQKRCEEVGSLA